jgi:RecJ-like exonuclease
METKVCPKCRKEYPLTDFYKNKRSHGGDGRSYYCKFCDRAVHKQNYNDRRDGICEKRRARYAESKQQAKPESSDILKSLAASLSPDVLAICLEVRAQNSRKHQPAARAGAGD